MTVDEALEQVDPVDILTSGRITTDDLGKTVYLSNSAIVCQEWIIADVNHDNTTDTVDLISKTTLDNYDKKMSWDGSNWAGVYYIGSGVDTYLENTVYNGFSDSIKNAINYAVVPEYPKVQRHVILLSSKEFGYMSYSNKEEGTVYPIFEPVCSPNPKIACITPDGVDRNDCYWTRTFYNDGNGNGFTYNVNDDGYIGYSYNNGFICLTRARIRFAKA